MTAKFCCASLVAVAMLLFVRFSAAQDLRVNEWPLGAFTWNGAATSSLTLDTAVSFIYGVQLTTPGSTFGPNINSTLQATHFELYFAVPLGSSFIDGQFIFYLTPNLPAAAGQPEQPDLDPLTRIASVTLSRLTGVACNNGTALITTVPTGGPNATFYKALIPFDTPKNLTANTKYWVVLDTSTNLVVALSNLASNWVRFIQGTGFQLGPNTNSTPALHLRTLILAPPAVTALPALSFYTQLGLAPRDLPQAVNHTQAWAKIFNTGTNVNATDYAIVGFVLELTSLSPDPGQTTCRLAIYRNSATNTPQYAPVGSGVWTKALTPGQQTSFNFSEIGQSPVRVSPSTLYWLFMSCDQAFLVGVSSTLAVTRSLVGVKSTDCDVDFGRQPDYLTQASNSNERGYWVLMASNSQAATTAPQNTTAPPSNTTTPAQTTTAPSNSTTPSQTTTAPSSTSPSSTNPSTTPSTTTTPAPSAVGKKKKNTTLIAIIVAIVVLLIIIVILVILILVCCCVEGCWDWFLATCCCCCCDGDDYEVELSN